MLCEQGHGMGLAISNFTDFILELQSHERITYQFIFELLQKYFGYSKFLLVSLLPDDGNPGIKKEKSMPVNIVCKNVPYETVTAFLEKNRDPFCRVKPSGDLMRRGIACSMDLVDKEKTEYADYFSFLNKIETSAEICMYLQEGSRYIAALSVFTDDQDLSGHDREILINTAKCIARSFSRTRQNTRLKFKSFHDLFDGVLVGAALLNQDLKIIDMNKAFSDYCKIIVINGHIDTELTMNSSKMDKKEINYAQTLIDRLGANIITCPEKIKIDCLLYNYRMYAKSIAFENLSGTINVITGVYLTEYKKIRNQKVLETLDTLTPREVEILTLMAYGYDNNEIVDKCCISLNTIKTHQRHIYQKFNVTNRSELIAKLYLVDHRVRDKKNGKK